MRYKTYHKVLVFAVPAISLAYLCAIAYFALKNFSFWPCPYYTYMHVYCPGCGMTRAVTALMRGDILMSLRQNVLALFGIVVALMFYIELVLKVFGRDFKFPLIHSLKFWMIVIAFIFAFTVARNFVPEIAPVGTRAGLGLLFD